MKLKPKIEVQQNQSDNPKQKVSQNQRDLVSNYQKGNMKSSRRKVFYWARLWTSLFLLIISFSQSFFPLSNPNANLGHEYCHRIPFLLALLKMRNRPSWLLVFHRGNRELKMTWRRKYALNPIYTTNLSQILSLISINRLLFFNCSNVHPF